jgi:hypothetical protein
MTSQLALMALQNNQLNMSFVSQALHNRILAVNIYYEDLAFTTLDQELNLELDDL